MNIDKTKLARIGIGLVILHVVINFAHALAHTNLFIAMSLVQNIYIYLVILAGPIIAAAFLHKNPKIGFGLLALTMMGSFLFGVYHHFIAISSDNVFTLGDRPWTTTFLLSAILLAIVELAGSCTGILGSLPQE